jgi:hypothetical protein
MENAFIYLIKASGLIGLFYLAYMLLLRKETFFTANRWFLLLGLITSIILPLFFITEIIWVEPTTDSFDWSTIPMTVSEAAPEPEINWYLIGAYVYFTGILVSFLKLVFDFYSLIKVLKGKNRQQNGHFKFIDITENIAPFSFFNCIVYNSSLYNRDELENILAHEKIHSQQKHSFDVLISRLFCVFFWFHPIIWLYKKAMVQNLEFIADSEASKNILDKKAYQLTLLKITTQENCVAITNHFYQSLIKKRIIMLNQNESKKWHSWKYITVFPALIAFVLLFQIEVVAQVKSDSNVKTIDKNSFELIWDRNTTDQDIQKDIQIAKEKGITITISDIVRNVKGEITSITINAKNDHSAASATFIGIPKISIRTELNGNKTISVASLSKNEDDSQGTTNELKVVKNDNINFTITKNTTDEEFKENCLQIKKTHNIDLTFSNIKRNSTGEIINIESKYEDIQGGSGSWTQTNNTSIKPFRFYTDGKTIGYANLDVAYLSKGKDIYINGEKSSEEELAKLDPNEIEKIEVAKTPNKETILITLKHLIKPVKITDKVIYIDGVKSTNEKFNKLDKNTVDKIDVNTFENTVRVTTKTIAKLDDKNVIRAISSQDGTKPLIIIDGIQADPNFKIEELPTDQIESINVLKGINAQTKYGEKAKDGVIEITTKEKIEKNEFESLQNKTVQGYKIKNDNNGWIIGFDTNGESNSISRIMENKSINYKKAVIVIDGKQSNYHTLEKINPNEVHTVIQADIKNASEENKNKAIQLYGKKALNGFIQIDTKTYKNK